MNTINKILIYFSIIWGAIFSVFGFFGFFKGDPSELIGYFFFYLFFGIAPLTVGLVLRKKLKNQPPSPPLIIERKLLNLAQQTKGKFTLSEASLALNMSLDRTRTVLEEYITKGILELEIDDNGIPIYIYREIYYLNQ